MDEHHLVAAAHLLLKQVHSVHNGVVADGCRAAVIHKAGGLQGFHTVVVDFGGNRQCQLGVCLAHGVAVAGQYGFIGQTDALHRLFDGRLAGGGGHLFNGDLAALGNVGGIADVGVGGYGDGVARHARQRVVNFGKGGNAQLFGDAGADHISHNLGVDQVGQLGVDISHSTIPFVGSIFFHFTVGFGVFAL